MRHHRIIVAVACGLAVSSAQLVAQGFDGVMWFAEHKEGWGPDTIMQSTKGTRTRFGPGGGDALASNGTVWFNIFPDKKKYVIMHDVTPPPGTDNPGKPTRTGKTESVLGIPCQYWHFDGTDVNGAKQMGDACLAKGAGLMVGRMTNWGALFGPAGIAYHHAHATDGGVMKVVIDGTVVLEAIKKQASALPDTLFTWPKDYTPTTMAELFSHH